MLLRLLKAEYLPALDALRDDESFAGFVSILGEMLVGGEHAIWTAPVILDQFSQWPHISRMQADALKEMARVVSLRELPFDAATDALILTGPAVAEQDPPPPTRWHRRPWTWLLARGRLPRTCLGGENVADANWFTWLGRVFSARQRPGALGVGAEVSLRPRGFGGSTAEPELREEVLSGTPLLCILDSDRDHPAASPGDTASRALKAEKKLREEGAAPLLHIELLAARDVENLLPHRVVQEIGNTRNPWNAPMLRRGFFADDIPRPELRYIDIGKDQCERRLLDTADPTTLKYRKQALAALRTIDPTCPGGAESKHPACPGTCGAATGPSKWADMQNDCLHVRSVGKQLLPAVVAHVQAQDAPGKEGSIRWLDARVPNDPALLGPAALAWSWGLGLPRRVRATPTPLNAP